MANNILVTINNPVTEVNKDTMVSTLRNLGVQSLGGFAEILPKYGKGARYLGTLFKIGSIYCTLQIDIGKQHIAMNPIEWQQNYVMAVNMPIEVCGGNDGEKVLFPSEEEAVRWLKLFTAIEQLKLSIKTSDYNGPVVMYLEGRK